MAGIFARGLAAGLVAVIAIAASYGGALAEKRIALVIGNSKYIHASELKNPANDAEAMSDKLEKLSFEVIKGVDLDENGMRKAINEFAAGISNSNVALLFYAGHGLQVQGQNYLLPVNAELKNEIDLQFQGVSVNFLLRIMESASRTSIVLLDACRNNPLAERLSRSMANGRGTAVSSGLARIETGVGTYIGFATSPDNVALDGDGINSPFTTALLRHIGSEDTDIESLMRIVRQDVIAETNGHQVPWGNSSLVGSGFVFKKAEEKIAAAPQPEPPVTAPEPKLSRDLESAVLSSMRDQTEAIYWQSIQSSQDPKYFEIYLQQFPNGVFAALARLKINTLQGAEAKAAAAAQSAKVAAAPEVKAPEAKIGDDAAAGTLAAKTGSASEQKVASIAPSVDVAIKEPLQPAGPSRAAIVDIQRELVRLGCLSDRSDGNWGAKSRDALSRYGEKSGVALTSVEPSLDLLQQLKGVADRVCPLVCADGFAETGGACVAATAEPETKKSAKVEPAPEPKKKAGAEKAEPVVKILPLFKRDETAAPVAKKKLTIHQTLKNVHESNKHMLWGQDSDGSQM